MSDDIPREEKRPPTKLRDHKTLLVAVAFGLVLVLLIALNMN
jgi:hypothetical protein